jgi:hypothetical protein
VKHCTVASDTEHNEATITMFLMAVSRNAKPGSSNVDSIMQVQQGTQMHLLVRHSCATISIPSPFNKFAKKRTGSSNVDSIIRIKTGVTGVDTSAGKVIKRRTTWKEIRNGSGVEL